MLNVLAFHCLSLTPVFCSPAWPPHSIFLYLHLLIKHTSKFHEIMIQNHYLGYMIINILLLISTLLLMIFNFPRNHSSFTYYLSIHHDFLKHKLCLHSYYYYIQCFNFIYACLNRRHGILLINSNTAKCNQLNYYKA